MADYVAIGFDMDHALVRYKLPALMPLIYDAVRKFLVQERSSSYTRSLLDEAYAYDPSFVQKGLVLCWKSGNFVKLDSQGRVLRASHGTRMLTQTELTAQYIGKWEHFESLQKFQKGDDFLYFTNYFDLPLIYILAVLIDRADAQLDAECTEGADYLRFRADLFSALDYNYDTDAFALRRGWFFPPIIDDTERFVYRQPELKNWLKAIRRERGVRVLVATNSHIEFTNLLLAHTFSDSSISSISSISSSSDSSSGGWGDAHGSGGVEAWRGAINGCVDMLVVNSRKPRWFQAAAGDVPYFSLSEGGTGTREGETTLPDMPLPPLPLPLPLPPHRQQGKGDEAAAAAAAAAVPM